MRKAFAVLIQFVLFLTVFLAGSLFFHPFHLQMTLASDSGHVRAFMWDGLLMMTLLYVLVLALESARKRLRTSAAWSTLAFFLAVGAGLAMKFGFIVTDR